MNGILDEGIIAEVLPNADRIGLMESRQFLWLRMRDVPRMIKDDIGMAKYRIPFDRLAWLQKVMPHDLARIRDLNDIYQPFLGVMHEQPETGYFDSNGLVIDPWGLIYDDVLEAYI